MSKIKSKLDQKEVTGGKVSEKQKAAAAKKEAEKAAEGGDGKLSKKELNKLKKKENKAAGKKGEAPPNPKNVKPDAAKANNGDGTALFTQFEATLSKQNFLGGNALSKQDHEAMLQVLPFRFKLKAKDFPHTFAWFSFVCKFSQPYRDHQGVTLKATAPASSTGSGSANTGRFAELEKRLSNSQYLNGGSPTQEDNTVY